MRRRKQRKKLIIILCFLLLLMTVAYATFQTKIKVVGNTKITSNWDIRITNVTEVNKTGSGESTNAPLWTNLTAYMEADLYEKGDSVEYDVTIENKGTLDAQLEDIISNVKSNNEAVKISFSGYAKGEKLFKNNKKSIKVKIEYNPDFNGKAEGSGEVEVSFDYGQAEGGTITPSKDTYLLTYDYKTNGGTDTAVYDEYVEQGQEISLGYSPVKVGYEFIGWNTDKDAMIGLESYQMPNQATTLYAIYRKKVTVNYEKSSAVESINRNSDTCYLYNNDKTCEITLPTITANTGYTVSGWYNGETKVGNANAKYNASTNVNLVAKASVNSYNVTYNYSSNGGTSSTKTSAKINYNESVDLTPKATKDGWTFVGWNTNKNATTGLSALKMGTSDITLYAIYKKEAKTITITFNKNGAASQTVKGGSASTATTVTQSCTIPAVYNNNVQATTCNVTSPTIIGSTNTPTVVGYNTSSTATTSAWSHNTEKAVSSNATYYAITSKSAKTITITFNKNGAASQTIKGGSASTATTVTQSCTIPAVYNNNVQATTCNVTSPTIIGSTNTPTVVGYNTSSTATTSAWNHNIEKAVSSNATYYAVTSRAAKTITINYSKESSISTIGTTSNSCTIAATYNGKAQDTSCEITLPTITANTGYTVSGWYNGETKVGNANAKYNASTNVNLVAKASVNSYDVTYNYSSNGGTSSTKTSAKINYNESVDLTPKATKDGWTFVGWNTDKDAHTSISTLKMPDHDVTLYAIYRKSSKTLTATFNGNGALAGDSNKTCEIKEVYNNEVQGSSCTITLPSITRSGFTIHGWNTDKDSTSGTAVGTSVSINANTTYYAITSKAVTVTFNRNNATSITPKGGSASTATSLTQSCTIRNSQTTCNITSPSITAPSNTPTVIGWSTAAGTNSNQWSVNTAKAFSDNATYYAQTTKGSVTKTATFTVQDTNAVTASATTASCTIAATWNNTAQGTTCTAKAPTLTAKTGYTAIGWNTNKAATTSSLNSGANVTLNSNTTYYSITKNNTNLTSTFTLQDTNAATTSATSASCTKYNGATSCSVTAPTLTAKTGYTAYGWNTNRAATTSGLNSGANITLSSNATYYSITRNNTALTATFNGNGATSASASGNCYRFNGASSCAVKSPSITRSGFTIHGWNTNKDATSGTAAESNLSLSANTTYYAITSKAVTVTFNRNNATSITPSGGSASTATSLTQSCTIRNSQTTCNITSPSITAPSNTPTVIGWSTASGTNSNQWSVNTAKAFSANATYYAQTTKAAVTRTATFNVQDTNAATTSSTNASCTIAATWNNTAQGTTCTAKAPTLTAKTGYTAIGWNTNKAATTSGLNSGADVTLNSNVTYYSITKNNTNLTATFNGNGATAGSSSASCTRYNGASSCNVSLPSITRNGFTIHGWNTNKDATSGTAVGTSVSISANSTYYAITSKAVTVTFNRNNATSITPSGGSASTAASLTQSCTIKNSQTNCNITSPSITAPSNTPTVIGWSTASGTNSNQWSVNTAKAFSDNATYYAQTTKAAVTRTATFNVQDTNAATTSSTTASCTIAATWNNTVQGTTCTAKAPTLTAKTGYTAIGWNTNKAATTSGLNSGANVTLSSNATYYSITKNNTNLTGTFSLQDTNAATASATSVSCTKYNGATSCSITAPTLTAKTGYTAIGWNTNKAATTSGLNSGANVTLSSNATYYSITRTTTNFHVTFNVRDANAATTSSMRESCYKYNGATSCSVKAPTLTAKTGYTAYGWNTDRTSTTSSLNSGASATVSSNTDYYSITRNNTPFIATFNGNGATSGSASESCYRYNGASTCNVILPSITRSGFNVMGWNTDKDADGGFVVGRSEILTKNTTYYAITFKAVTATFSKGSNVSAIGSTSGRCVIKNSATTCAVTTPTITANTGYTSVGWSTTNGASSGTAAGSNVSISANTTYYANALDKTAPTISFNPNTQTSYTNGTAVVLTIADSGSGVKPGQNIYYAWSTSPTSEPAFSKYLTIPSESKSLTLTVPVSASNNLTGTYYLWIKSGINDVAGNVSSSKVSSSFKFDATAPTLSFTTAKTTKSITVTATASATSGIKKYEYSKDGGSTWVTGTGNTYTFGSLTHNTAYNIKVRVTSNSGKVTTADAKSVTTDKLALPTFTETNEGEVTVTYPSGCASPYTCSYNKGSDVTVTSNPVVYLGTDGNIIAKVTDGTNTVTSTYTVTRKNFYVSSSGSDTSGFGTINKPYSTIAKAYNQTVSTSSINVMNNITQTSTVNLNSNKTITLKSHGNTNSIIRGSSFQDKLLYLTSGKLTIEDITLDGNNVTATSPLIVVNGASASLNTKTKTTLKNNKNTYLYDDNTSNSIKRGGALGVVSGNITIDDIDINNNTEAHSGGGIIQTNGTLNINGGTIQSNTAGYGAGGIYTTNTTGTWQNITIKNNTVTGVKYGDGGAASIYGNSNIQLKSGTISGNSAKRNGAGLTVNGNAKLTITGGSITSNEASGVGGGLMVGDDSSSSTATIYLKGGTIQYNKASGGGGGIYAWGYGTIDYTSGNVFDNTGGSNYKTNNVYLYANGKYTDHQVSSSSPFTFKAPDVYKVASAVNNDYVMGIQGDSSANGTNVRAWSYYGGTSQKWKIYVSEIRDNKSVYTFASQLSGNPHLWVAGNTNTTSGTNVVIYALHGNTGGFWWIEDASGYRKIRSKGGSNYLNLTGGTAANGTNIQILAGNSSNAQKWKFIGV